MTPDDDVVIMGKNEHAYISLTIPSSTTGHAYCRKTDEIAMKTGIEQWGGHIWSECENAFSL